MHGSTHAQTIQKLIPEAAIVVAPKIASYYRSFIEENCQVIAGEPIDVALATVESYGLMETSNFFVSGNFYSMEPLSIVTRDDDDQFSDLVDWVLQGLI